MYESKLPTDIILNGLGQHDKTKRKKKTKL